LSFVFRIWDGRIAVGYSRGSSSISHNASELRSYSKAHLSVLLPVPQVNILVGAVVDVPKFCMCHTLIISDVTHVFAEFVSCVILSIVDRK
jgi:hypothetical protein